MFKCLKHHTVLINVCNYLSIRNKIITDKERKKCHQTWHKVIKITDFDFPTAVSITTEPDTRLLLWEELKGLGASVEDFPKLTKKEKRAFPAGIERSRKGF
jgi:hypothetical protein